LLANWAIPSAINQILSTKTSVTKCLSVCTRERGQIVLHARERKIIWRDGKTKRTRRRGWERERQKDSEIAQENARETIDRRQPGSWY